MRWIALWSAGAAVVVSVGLASPLRASAGSEPPASTSRGTAAATPTALPGAAPGVHAPPAPVPANAAGPRRPGDGREAVGTASGQPATFSRESVQDLRVFLTSAPPWKEETYRFLVRLRAPTDVTGIDTLTLVRARAVMGRPKAFIPDEYTVPVESVGEPARAIGLAFFVPVSAAVETPGVNHWVTLTLRIQGLVFDFKTGLQRDPAGSF